MRRPGRLVLAALTLAAPAGGDAPTTERLLLSGTDKDTEDLFLRVFTPRSGDSPQFTAVTFPEGDLSFLHGIPPIGTKFAGPEGMGPESQPNEAVRDHPTQNMGAYTARLFFFFGDGLEAPERD